MIGRPRQEILRQLPHFQTVPPPLLERIASQCTARTLRAGETIFHEGDPATAFFVVIEGGAVLYRANDDGKRQVMNRVRPGQTFAEAAALTMRIYPATAEATHTPTELLAIDTTNLLCELEREPKLAAAMIGSLSAWLRRMVERVDELSAASAGARLARHLLRLPASGKGARLRIELPMAKKDLAEHLAITPETLSRLLKRWSDRGLIDNEGKVLVVLDPELLETIATGDESES